MGATPAVRARARANAPSRNAPAERTVFRFVRDARPFGRRASGEKLISNYELFNRNNMSIRFRSWNYRGCWHQTCPPIDTRTTRAQAARRLSTPDR